MKLASSSIRLAELSGAQRPTLWGLSPLQLHDSWWASKGVKVVRFGRPKLGLDDSPLYMLVDDGYLTLLDEDIIWSLRRRLDGPIAILSLRVHEVPDNSYSERVLFGDDDSFLKIERSYVGTSLRTARAAIVADKEKALAWQKAATLAGAWRGVRKHTPRTKRQHLRVGGNVYDVLRDADVNKFVQHLQVVWHAPSETVPSIVNRFDQVWTDPTAYVPASARMFGPVWVGAGRRLDANAAVLGPAVLWDAPNASPEPARSRPESVRWPTPVRVPMRQSRTRQLERMLPRFCKRAFDVVFALCALGITLPFWPVVMLAIWLEDGRPFFFGHRRQTMGGREFHCWKFRSMRKDAEAIKRKIMAQNQSDGPQFHMKNDPRLTRVGRVIRKVDADEWPQFWNILKGDMSVVGPRPSPHGENQYCPAWREARLSVRPGLTGLWQVERTREPGKDFQEWILYDLQYVETATFWLDLTLIARTITSVLGWRKRR